MSPYIPIAKARGFTATLGNGVKQKSFEEISELVNGRMIKNAEYYRKESSITSAYRFVKKIVDFLYENSI